MTRQEYNRKIIDFLRWYVETYPDLRFGQILLNSSVITHADYPQIRNDGSSHIILDDPFYEESEKMWKRISTNPVKLLN